MMRAKAILPFLPSKAARDSPPSTASAEMQEPPLRRRTSQRDESPMPVRARASSPTHHIGGVVELQGFWS